MQTISKILLGLSVRAVVDAGLPVGGGHAGCCQPPEIQNDIFCKNYKTLAKCIKAFPDLFQFYPD